MAIGDVSADERLDDRVLGRHEHALYFFLCLDELEKDLDAVALDGGLLVARE